MDSAKFKKKIRNQQRNKRQKESRRKKQIQLIKMNEEITATRNELKLSKLTCHRLRSMISTTHANKSSATGKSMTLCATGTSKGVFTHPERVVCKLESKTQVQFIERYALKSLGTKQEEVLGKGSFGCCHKMFLSATEVAVKEYKSSLSTRSMILYEAKIMSTVCCGHPNLPLFMGVYDYTGCLPYLVTKYYSVDGEPLTLHKLLRKDKQPQSSLSSRQWVQLAIGICCAIESIHGKHILHNDVKCDNIVLSDLIPAYANSPPLWPILIDFGKARPFVAPKRYFLNDDDRALYRREYPHLAPELIQGTHAQNIKTDIFSVGRVLSKIYNVYKIECLATVVRKCMSEKPENRPTACSLHSSLCEIQ